MLENIFFNNTINHQFLCRRHACRGRANIIAVVGARVIICMIWKINVFRLWHMFAVLMDINKFVWLNICNLLTRFDFCSKRFGLNWLWVVPQIANFFLESHLIWEMKKIYLITNLSPFYYDNLTTIEKSLLSSTFQLFFISFRSK